MPAPVTTAAPSTNPGSAIQYNPANPYNLNPDGTPMAGTGNFTGPSMPTTPVTTPAATAPVTTAPLTPATPATVATPATTAPATPGNTPTGDSGVTANQYQIQPGESIDAYNARIAALRAAGGVPTPGTNPTDINSAQDQLAQSMGYKSFADMEAQLSAPTTSETDLYNQAYSAAGLDTIQNTINSRQNDLNNATANINDNPWLDEATRVGRNKTLTDLANADIKNYQDEYNAKLKEVQDLVTRETADQTTTSKANSAKLASLEAQAKALAAQNTASAKTAAAAPTTIKGANGATYQWNAKTQTFDQILPGKAATPAKTTPPVPPASATGTGPQFNSFNFSATQLGALNAKGLSQSDANGILQDIKNGQTLDNIRQQMQAAGIDPGLLDQIMLYVDPAHNTPAKKTSSTSSSSGSSSGIPGITSGMAPSTAPPVALAPGGSVALSSASNVNPTTKTTMFVRPNGDTFGDDAGAGTPFQVQTTQNGLPGTPQSFGVFRSTVNGKDYYVPPPAPTTSRLV